jgi:hypothetical protein
MRATPQPAAAASQVRMAKAPLGLILLINYLKYIEYIFSSKN